MYINMCVCIIYIRLQQLRGCWIFKNKVSLNKSYQYLANIYGLNKKYRRNLWYKNLYNLVA